MEPQVLALRAIAQKFSEKPIEALTREDLGPAGFKECAGEFKAMLDLMKRIAVCSWTGVPKGILDGCTMRLAEFFPHVDRILQFDVLKSGNAAGERENLIRNFNSQYSGCYSFISPHLCFAEGNEGVDSYKTDLAKLIGEASAAKSDIEAKQGQIKQLVEGLGAMAQKSGVANQAEHFKKLADQYRWGALLWLVGAATAGYFLWSYVSVLYVPAAENIATVLAMIFPRLISVTLLSTALIFCLKNFGALAHNVIVNRHRQTALTTFTVFVSSTDDGPTKNAVLVQATQAIFSPQPSGYLKNDTEMPQVNQITEIVRGISTRDKN